MPPGFFLTQPRSLRPEASRFLPVPCCPTHPGLGLAQGSRLGRQTDLREAGPGLCLSAGSWPPAGRCSIRPWGPPGRRFGRDPWWIRGGPGRVLGSRPGNRDPQTQVGLRRSPFQPLAAGPPHRLIQGQEASAGIPILWEAQRLHHKPPPGRRRYFLSVASSPARTFLPGAPGDKSNLLAWQPLKCSR